MMARLDAEHLVCKVLDERRTVVAALIRAMYDVGGIDPKWAHPVADRVMPALVHAVLDAYLELTEP